MTKPLFLFFITALLIIMILVVSCAGRQSTTTKTTTPLTTSIPPSTTTTNQTTPASTTPGTTITTPLLTTTTWGEKAKDNDFGVCGFRCHGEAGEGDIAPAIIGSNANLNRFETAQSLLDYISTEMPQDEPGSLSNDSYIRIMAYLLIVNGFIYPETIFDDNDLVNVILE